MSGGATAPRYVGMAPDELDGLFDFHGGELEEAAILGLFAATEAALRIDFNERVRQRWKEPVSRHFRDLDRKFSGRVPLEEILNGWRDQALAQRVKTAVGDFKGAFKLRDWLAHGRYWKPKLGLCAGVPAGRRPGYLPCDPDRNGRAITKRHG